MAAFGGSFGGFGQQQSQPAFGAAGQTPFGQQQPASPFGQQSAPAFGGQPAQQGGMFGAPNAAPAFGGGFGQQSSGTAFGSTSFGGTSQSFGSGFGSPQPAAASPFGTSQPGAFGSASSPPSFGFGGQQSAGFGANSSPFGNTAPAAFGASSSAFGASPSPGFGAGTPGFGQTGGGFGQGGFPFGGQQQQQQQQQSGTRGLPFNMFQEQEGPANSSTKTTVRYGTITCMPGYSNKSTEELRWEDYQAGCKGSAGPVPSYGQQQQQQQHPQQQQAGSLFGPQSSSAFGTPGGQSQPALNFGGGFGQASSAGGFNFSSSSSPAWGGQSAASPFSASSTFGASSPAPFGPSSSSSFGFGGSTAKPFGQPSQPSLFGNTPSSQPGFGSGPGAFAFGGTPQSSAAGGSSPFGTGNFAFGQSSAAGSPFGQSPGFGGAPQSSSAFSFSTPSSQPAASGGSIFGGGNTFGFGQSSAAAGSAPFTSWSTPAANSGGGMFNFSNQSTPGMSPSTGGGLFGPQSSPSMFGGGGGIFGTPQSQSGSTFNIFGNQQQQQQQQPQQQQQQYMPAAMPTVGGSPYGVMPQPLQVGSDAMLELRTGLSSRPLAPLSGARSAPRIPALFGPRTLSHGIGARARPRATTSRSSGMSNMPSPVSSHDRGVDGSPAASVLPFTPRANPREFFLRDPLPSTEPAARHDSAGPSRTSSPKPFASPLRPSAADPSAGERVQASERSPAEAAPQGRSATANGSTPASRAAMPSRRTATEDDVGPANCSGSDRLSDGNTRTTPLDRRFKDSEIARLLPKLERPDHRTEPTLEVLAAMARDDPKHLMSVPSFTVSRRSVGRIRWLQHVDVRGLDLDAIVHIDQGAVAVYLDNPGQSKPEPGEGLNKPAEVTLYGVYKRSKQTGEILTDPADVDAYRKRLMRLSATQRSRFCRYDPQGGVWRFEVEHFSRYGLPESDDDSDEDLESATIQGVRKRRSPRSPLDPRANRAGLSEADDDDLDLDDADVPEGPIRQRQRSMTPPPGSAARTSDSDQSFTGDGSDVGADDVSPDASAAARSPLLQQSLAARTHLAPQGLSQLHRAMYSADHSDTPQGSIPAFRRTPLPKFSQGVPGLSKPAQQQQQQQHQPIRRELAAFSFPQPADAQRADAASNRAKRAPGSTAWQTPVQAIRTPAPAGASQPHTPSSALTASPSADVAAHLSADQSAPAAVPMPSILPGEDNMIDAGLCMRRSFGVAWSPSGCYAHIGSITGKAGSIPGTSIVVSHASAHSPMIPESASEQPQHSKGMLELWARQLQLQLSRSNPQAAAAELSDPAGRDGAAVPRWGLQCSRDGELHTLSRQMRQLCRDSISKGGLQAVERVCLEHEDSTWHLLDVLFSTLPPMLQHYPDADGTSAGAESETQAAGGTTAPALAQAAGAADMAEDAAVPGQASNAGAEQHSQLSDSRAAEAPADTSLAASFVRRTALSSWLKAQASQPAKKVVLAAHSPMLQVAHLLAAGRAAVAARLAQAHGDVKLAAAIAQAGHVSGPVVLAQQQLAGWQGAGMEPSIHPDRLMVWRLLAGQLDDVILALNLEWRQAFALHLWYGRDGPAAVAAAYEGYTMAAEQDRAPEPTPPYFMQALQSTAEAPMDVCYCLLEPQVHRDGASGSMAAATAQMLVARALAPGCMTPDPLSLLPPWRLLCLLQAVHALPSHHAAQQVSQLVAGAVAQLSTQTGMQRWAIFAALHLPNSEEALPGYLHPGPAPAHATRSAAVRQLLLHHAPTFAQSTQAFLTDTLHVPREWMAEGLAALARSKFDAAGDFAQSVMAQDWQAAAAAFTRHLGPQHFWRADWKQIAESLQALQPAMASGLSGAQKELANNIGGVHVYAAYLAVKDQHRSSGLTAAEPQASPVGAFQQKLQAVCLTAQQLPIAQQAVYQRMSGQVAAWWAEDCAAANTLQLPMLLPAARMRHTGAAATAMAATLVG